MENAFYFQLISYSPLLKQESIRFKEDEKSFTVGKISADSGFALYISCRTVDTPTMLKKILPILKSSKAAFRLIKDQNLQYRMNSGTFGDEESGKVISIFAGNGAMLLDLITRLAPLTADFKGPLVSNAQQISKVLYLQKALFENGEIKLSKPTLKELPVSVNREYTRKQRANALLGKFYLPVQILRNSVKGNIYKGINLKRFAFNWCLIKQGNPVAFDDHFDRDMKDRLLWQKEIITSLQNDVCTPTYLDFFEKRGISYLVLEFAEGDSLGHNVRELLNGTEWKLLTTEMKGKLLGWYLKATAIVETLHGKELVHRDITDSNFIVLADDSLCIIDFELSYSVSGQKPYPPFLLGTFGYASPEQLKYLVPDMRDDIYSLGALLSFVLTGCQPHEFLNTSLQIVRTKLTRLSASDLLAGLAVKCLQSSRNDRPTIGYIKDCIEKYLETIKPKKNETLAMAI